eukprot:TRINITY_DN24_c0_g1_i1.p1 TRINITY_DN24_c0_g1~~TRINITY_DN24_c0_g1_i1.p1  ORF type:complete len:672 (-),score=84.83 TRINITY_DN24_c0_g1_i1:12102-14117(-)
MCLYETNVENLYYSLNILLRPRKSQYENMKNLLVSFSAAMIHNDSHIIKQVYLSVLKRKYKKKMDSLILVELVPLAREAMKRANHVSIIKGLFETFIPLVDSAEECYSLVKEMLTSMLVPESSYESKILSITLFTEFTLYAKRTQDLFNLKKVYKNALALLPNSTLAEHLILLQIEKIARSPYGEFATQYFFTIILRNLIPAKTKEEILRVAWTLHTLHTLIKEKLLTFEVTYHSIRVKLKSFETYLNSIIAGIGNIQFSIEEVLLVRNLLGFYEGFEEYTKSTLKLIGKLSRPEYDEGQKTTIAFTIKERSEKIMEIYGTLHKLLNAAWNEDITNKAAKAISLILPYVYQYGIEYTASVPGDLSRIEQNQYKRQLADKAKLELFESVSKKKGMEKVIASIINYELSNIVESGEIVTLKSVEEVTAAIGKKPTFVKDDYAKVFVRVIAEYMADKSEESAYKTLKILSLVRKEEIAKLPPVLFCINESMNSKSPAIVSLALKFIDTFCAQSTYLLSYALLMFRDNKGLLHNVMRVVQAEEMPVKSHKVVLAALLIKGEKKLYKEVIEGFAEVALSGDIIRVELLINVLRGIKKNIKEISLTKTIPLEVRRSFAKEAKSLLANMIKQFLIKNKGKLKEELQRSKTNKIDAKWVKAIFVLFQHATGLYQTNGCN